MRRTRRVRDGLRHSLSFERRTCSAKTFLISTWSETTLGCTAADRAAVDSPARCGFAGMPAAAAASAGMDCSSVFADPAENGVVAEKHLPNSLQPDRRAK